MKWSDALDQAKAKLLAVDEYVDGSGIVADALEQIEKHGGPVKEPLREAVELLDRMLNALVDDPDTVPNEPAPVEG